MNGKAFYKKPWYGSYNSMLNRCENPKANNYRTYGGRGIKVCSEWHDIENFEKWVNQSGYKNGLTLDRINTNGDYCPDNCRWATKKQQANNRRNTVRITINGITKTISEWAEFSGLSRSTINGRYRDGISGEMLLMKPKDTRFKKGYNRYGENRKHYADYPSNKTPILAKRYEANGELLSITELSYRYGIKRSVLENRARRGVELKQALQQAVIAAERSET